MKALRAFLRHLQHEGILAVDLAACVPKVAQRSDAELPKFLVPSEVIQVLEHCDRNTPDGRRDYAILLLLARLGLRAGEVSALRLDQINWEQGHLTLRGKGGRWTQFPLPVEVGEAIANYLTAGRPACTDRHVFIRGRAPRIGFAAGTGVSTLVRRALLRAGIDSPRQGARLFRHSLATNMLQRAPPCSTLASYSAYSPFAKQNLPKLGWCRCILHQNRHCESMQKSAMLTLAAATPPTSLYRRKVHRSTHRRFA